MQTQTSSCGRRGNSADALVHGFADVTATVWKEPSSGAGWRRMRATVTGDERVTA